jgi:hypothetical protein
MRATGGICEPHSKGENADDGRRLVSGFALFEGALVQRTCHESLL